MVAEQMNSRRWVRPGQTRTARSVSYCVCCIMNERSCSQRFTERRAMKEMLNNDRSSDIIDTSASSTSRAPYTPQLYHLNR